MFRTTAFVLLVLLGGCASGTASSGSLNPSPSITTSSTGVLINTDDSARPGEPLNGSLEEVWELLPQVYEMLAIPVTIRDPDTRSLGARRFTRSRLVGRSTESFVRCANSGPTTRRLVLRIVTTLSPAPRGQTRATTEVTGTSTSMDGTSTGAVRCGSTGDLEITIQRLLADLLAG